MKKISIMLGVLALALTLSACGTKSDDQKYNGTDAYGSGDNVSLETTATPILQDDATPIENAVTEAPATVSEDLTRVISGQKDLFKDYSGATIKTSAGDITVKFYAESPLTVNSFMNLAQQGFYNGTKFHRIMTDFMIQGGDPLTKKSDASVYGTGGPGYQFKNETSNHKLVAGSIAMANSGRDTNGSQFFIVTAESTPFLDGDYTNFGEVESGMAVVRKIEGSKVTASARGELSVPVDYVTINSIELVK